MSENAYDLKTVQKKLESLDSELTMFMQSIKEIKEIRDSVESLPERLRQREIEIEQQKKEVDTLISSTNKLFIAVQEQTRGIVYDLEKKAQDLSGHIEQSMSQVNTICEQHSIQRQREHKQELEAITKKFRFMLSSCEELKNMVDSHELEIKSLKNNCAAVSAAFGKINASYPGVQTRPAGNDETIKKVEERLTDLFFHNLEKQKRVVLITFGILLACIIFMFFFLYYPQ